MEDNNLNNLPQEAEPKAPPVDAGEQVSSGQVDTTPVVDEPPDASKMKAQIEALEAKRKKAEEDAIYWRKQKAEARAEYFRGREQGGETQPPQRFSPPGIGPEPKPSDFTDYDQFVGALTDHRVKVARAEWEVDAQRRIQEQTMQERQQTLVLGGGQPYVSSTRVAITSRTTNCK